MEAKKRTRENSTNQPNETDSEDKNHDNGKQQQTASDFGETKIGFMDKLAVKSRRNWKKRYFVLYKNLLSYYDREGDNRPKVCLLQCSIVHNCIFAF